MNLFQENYQFAFPITLKEKTKLQITSKFESSVKFSYVSGAIRYHDSQQQQKFK